MRRIGFAAALAACLAAPLAWGAPEALRGRVKDPHGKPVAGAVVRALDAESRPIAEAPSDASGRFTLEIPAGARPSTLQISGAGYLSVSLPMPSAAGREVEIALLPNRIVDRVNVTGSRREQSLFETPQAGSVVTSADMDEAGAATIPEAMEHEPGITMQRTTLGGGSPIMRGLIGNQVLVLVDGIPLNNSTFRFGPNQYLNTIDRYGTKSVEVIRGPVSTLYGSGALGGVVNIRTEDVPQAWSGDVSAGYDTALDAPFGAARVGGAAGRFAFVGGVSGASFDDIEGGNDTGVQSPTGFDRRAADVKMSFDMGEGGTLSAAGQYFEDQDVPRYDRVAAGRDAYHFFDPQRRTMGYLRYSNTLESMGKPTLSATFSLMDQTEGRRILGITSTSESLERDAVLTSGYALEMIWPEWKRTEFLGGIEVFEDDVDSSRERRDINTGVRTEAAPRFPDGASYLSTVAYAHARVRAASRLDLMLGGRYTFIKSEAFIEPIPFDYEAEFSDVTGMANFLFRATDHLHVSGGVSEGFRAPSLDDTTVFGHTNQGFDVPSPDVDPEHLLNYELSVKTLHPKLWASVTVYDAHLSDLIARAPGTFQGSSTFMGEPVFTRQNIGEARILGAELDFKVWLQDRVTASLLLQACRGTDKESDEPLSKIPPRGGRFGVRTLLPWRTAWAEVAFSFADRQDRLSPEDRSDIRIPEGGTRGYGVVDLGFGVGEVAGWQGSLWLNNLGDVDYRIHGSGINNPGRSVRFLMSRSFAGGR